MSFIRKHANFLGYAAIMTGIAVAGIAFFGLSPTAIFLLTAGAAANIYLVHGMVYRPELYTGAWK